MKVTGLIAIVTICCFLTFLVFFAGAGVFVVLMKRWSYELAGFIVILGGVIFFVYGKIKAQRKRD